MSEVPGLTLPQPSRPPRPDRQRRWMLIGCVAGLVILCVFLYASFSMISRSMLGLAERACDRVARRLPIELDSDRRQQVLDSLERFRREIERVEDPNPLVGGFLGRVAAALEDDLLTLAEVEELSAFIESQIGQAESQAGSRPAGGARSGTEPPAGGSPLGGDE